MTNDKRVNFKVGNDERGKGLAKTEERAIIIGLILPNQTEEQVHEYFDELEFLALTAGAKTIKRFTQRLPHPDTRLFVGKGKLEEIETYVRSHPEVTMAILEDDVSPKQYSNIEEALKIKVLDRSSLILDIFAQRAQTAQARTQV